MINNILRWLAEKNLIRLKIIKDNKTCYCPLCLSDIEDVVRGSTFQCPTCGAKIQSN